MLERNLIVIYPPWWVISFFHIVPIFILLLIVVSMSVCSPVANDNYEKDRTCFDKAALVRLAESWNNTHKNDQIKNINKLTKKKLWGEINRRMLTRCKGGDKEACWVDHLTNNSDPVAKNLRPIAPKEWKKNPYTWLSNYDIEDAMFQYEDDMSYNFKFIGVYPIDFAAKTSIFGKCLYQETCDIDFKRLLKKGYKYAGMVINMDAHDEPGSHWTSLFIIMDPSSPNYGAYYYDSVSRPPPKEVDEYMKILREKAQATDPTKDFQLEYNKYRHQYKNTECGMFSMSYIVRWLVFLKKNPSTHFEKIVNIKIRDEDMYRLRKKLFRQSSK